MSNVCVLIIVDVEGALSSSLDANVYLVDTNKYMGSGAEGQEELKTACKDGDVVIWSVAPVDPNTNVTITSFTGQMVSDNICKPMAVTGPNGTSWQGRVEAQGVASTQQYSVILTMDGKPMSFDPFLVISV